MVEDHLQIGDLVRLLRDGRSVGLVMEVSDAWMRGRPHHVRVRWLASDDPQEARRWAPWIPVKELEVISKIGEKKVDNE